MIKNIIFDIGGIILGDSDDNLSKVLGEDVSSLISKIHGPIFKEYLAGKIDYSSYLNSFKFTAGKGSVNLTVNVLSGA